MRIDELNLLILSKKEELKEEDYKIIKCFESFVLSKAMPYPIDKLILKRDELRNEINTLELRKRELVLLNKETE
jgi:hypothetical protein